MVAVIGSALVALAGVYLLLSPDAAGLAPFAWLFVVVGVIGTLGHLAMRVRARRAGPHPGQRRG